MRHLATANSLRVRGNGQDSRVLNKCTIKCILAFKITFGYQKWRSLISRIPVPKRSVETVYLSIIISEILTFV